MKYPLLLILLLHLAMAQPPVLTGKIGTYPVVVEISCYQDYEYCDFSHYFYTKYKQVISLDGNMDPDGTYHLKHALYDAKTGNEKTAESEYWTLKEVRAGVWEGTWKMGKKTLPIRLHPLDPDSIQHPYADMEAFRGMDNFTYARSNDMKIVRDSLSQQNGFTLRWVEEINSGIILPRLESGAPPTQMNLVNARLETLQMDLVSNWYTCYNHMGQGDFDASLTHLYMDAHLFSLCVLQGWDCGGAHPDFGSITFTWDLETGKELKLGHLLDISNKPDGEPDRERFETMLLTTFTKMYPEMMVPDPDNCDYSDGSVWSSSTWYIRKDGIYIGAYFMRAARACDDPEWSVLPWDNIRPIMKAPYSRWY